MQALVSWQKQNNVFIQQDTSIHAARTLLVPPRHSLVLGREGDFEAIQTSLSQANQQTILIDGQPGVGKTTFTIDLAHDESL